MTHNFLSCIILHILGFYKYIAKTFGLYAFWYIDYVNKSQQPKKNNNPCKIIGLKLHSRADFLNIACQVLQKILFFIIS